MQTNIPIAKQPFIVASKRKKNSPPEETILQQDICLLPQKLNDISEMIQSNSTFDNEKITNLTQAIDNLASVLTNKLDTIIDLLKSRQPTPLASSTTAVNLQPIGTLEKLRDLKNARNSSVYKLSYNKTHSEVYTNGLKQNPILVPKKLCETIGVRDPGEMQDIKNKRTIRKVEDEIEMLQYHSKIHESKIASMDKKAEELINNISNVEEKNRTYQKWRQLISLGQENIEKKWSQKKIFLQSDKHIIALGTRHRVQQHYDEHNKPRQSFNDFSSNLLANQSYSRVASETTSNVQHCRTSCMDNLPDVDMESEWTVVQNPKNSQRLQGSPRLNQRLSKSSTSQAFH